LGQADQGNEKVSALERVRRWRFIDCGGMAIS